MTTYVPPKKGTAFIFYVGLSDMSALPNLRNNPTIATGDVKVEVDGTALGNITTLPVVTPSSTRSVKVSLSASEMSGDNIVVKFIDQTTPKEWADLMILIQTSANQIDDLALSATALSTAVWTNTKAGYIDVAISSRQSLGGGSTSTTITINDTGGSPLDGVDVWVSTDAPGVNIVARGFTNTLGNVTFMLDPGTYYVWKQLAGYSFANPQTMTV